MKNIVYCKYSNDRGNKFNIKTSIAIDEDNNKIVYKEASSIESEEHIKNIYKHYKILSENYNKNNIAINKCEWIDNKLKFEYLEGKTLENILDELFQRKDYSGIVDKIKEYITRICNLNVKIKFEVTEEFTDVFGKVNLPSNLESSYVNNIDLVFSNIIVTDIWNVIDYEWTFDFPVPFNYIIYRAIYYYVHGSSKRSDLISLDLFKLVGISSEERIEYEKMEKHFQNYILGSNISLWRMYDNMGKKRIDVSQLISNSNFIDINSRAQVFYDRGAGYSEEDSYFCNPYNDKNNLYNLKIKITDEVNSIRIDPSSNYCIVKVNSVMRIGETCDYIDYYSNGINLSDDLILFTTMDPQIIISDLNKSETNMIEIEFKNENISFEIVKSILYLLGKKNDLNEQLKVLEIDKVNVVNEIEMLKNENINSIKNIEDLQRTIRNLNDDIEKKDKVFDLQEKNLIEKDNEINNLSLTIKKQSEYITKVHNTKVWKMYMVYKKVVNKFLK